MVLRLAGQTPSAEAICPRTSAASSRVDFFPRRDKMPVNSAAFSFSLFKFSRTGSHSSRQSSIAVSSQRCHSTVQWRRISGFVRQASRRHPGAFANNDAVAKRARGFFHRGRRRRLGSGFERRGKIHLHRHSALEIVRPEFRWRVGGPRLRPGMASCGSRPSS